MENIMFNGILIVLLAVFINLSLFFKSSTENLDKDKLNYISISSSESINSPTILLNKDLLEAFLSNNIKDNKKSKFQYLFYKTKHYITKNKKNILSLTLESLIMTLMLINYNQKTSISTESTRNSNNINGIYKENIIPIGEFSNKNGNEREDLKIQKIYKKDSVISKFSYKIVFTAKNFKNKSKKYFVETSKKLNKLLSKKHTNPGEFWNIIFQFNE